MGSSNHHGTNGSDILHSPISSKLKGSHLALLIPPFFFVNLLRVLALLIYVDDILIIGNSDSFTHDLIQKLHNLVNMKDLGPIFTFLGITVQHTLQGYILHQASYITDLLKLAGMQDCKPVSTPISSKPPSDPHNEQPTLL